MVWQIVVESDAKRFYNKKSYPIDKRFTNDCLAPKIFSTIPENMPIGTIIYNNYYNCVFNSVYLRIKLGNRYWSRYFNLKIIFKSLFFWYFGISRLMLLIFSNALKIKNVGLETWVYKNLTNPYDTRLIIRLDNKWHANGGQAKKLNDFVMKRFPENTSSEKIQSFFHEMNKLYLLNKKYEAFSLEERVWVKHPNLRIQHHGYTNICRDKDMLGYVTDKAKAVDNNNYGKETIVEQFMGTKPSILLLDSKDMIKVSGGVRKVPTSDIAAGAIIHGYNEDYISNSFQSTITSKKEIFHIGNCILKQHEVEASKEELYNMLKDVDDIGKWI